MALTRVDHLKKAFEAEIERQRDILESDEIVQVEVIARFGRDGKVFRVITRTEARRDL